MPGQESGGRTEENTEAWERARTKISSSSTELSRIEDRKVREGGGVLTRRRPRSFCMRLRKRWGGLPVARPQTPHVPSCRLKLGAPRPPVCMLKTHGKSRELTARANRVRGGAHRGGGGNVSEGAGELRWWWWWWWLRERKNQLTNLPAGSDARPKEPSLSYGPALSSGIRRYSVIRSPANFLDCVVLKARRSCTWSTLSMATRWPRFSSELCAHVCVYVCVRVTRHLFRHIRSPLARNSATSRYNLTLRATVSISASV